jgi:hypothetical protein
MVGGGPWVEVEVGVDVVMKGDGFAVCWAGYAALMDGNKRLAGGCGYAALVGARMTPDS